MQRKYNSMERISLRIEAITRRREAKQVLFAVFSVIAMLVFTALLATPHLRQEPVEVDAFVEASPEPTVFPAATPEPFRQHTEYALVLVNGEIMLPDDFTLKTRAFDGVEVNTVMYEALCEMMDAARADGCRLWLASGYRSVEKQTDILNRAVQNRMKDGMTEDMAYKDALKTIQKPGCSEHHTGLAIDFNDVSYSFEESFEYAWLKENAAEFGFIERYPEDKEEITGILFEPWHFRYVGKEHAGRMVQLGVCLEEYLADICNG